MASWWNPPRWFFQGTQGTDWAKPCCSGTKTGTGAKMSTATPRMRMFAGPNGSGKSIIKGVIEPELLGVYINPDDIEKEIFSFGFLDFSFYGVETTADEVLLFFRQSPFLAEADLL